MSRRGPTLNTLPEDEEIDPGLRTQQSDGATQQLGGSSIGEALTARDSHSRKSIFSKIRNRDGVSLDENILRQSAAKKKQGLSASFSPQNFSRFSSVKRGNPPKITQKTTNIAEVVAQQPQGVKVRAHYQRKTIGDNVLVRNDQSQWAVNKHGFPAGEGNTPEEQRGPYHYVLATVKKIHFGENIQYYTVTRADTGRDQRADHEGMLPIKGSRAEQAALRAAQNAANQSQTGQSAIRNDNPSPYDKSETKCLTVFETIICLPLAPFFWFAECFVNVIGKRLYQLGARALASTRFQGKLFLNGLNPYACSIRITSVNVLVVCSIWYVFIDQARLAFLSPKSDDALAIISLIVWAILVMELLFEVLIRPDGYNALVASEKAYAPSTVRYINYFHLVVESFSLAVFVPEFLCLWNSSLTCSDRPAFSYFNAVFMAIIGPRQSNAFYGRAYFALVRLRIFGLVRHWRIMWINNQLVSRKPTRSQKDNKKDRGSKERMRETTDIEKVREDSLINASNIGTALMVTNSHRCLMMLCAIVGIFPIIGTLNTNGGTNQVTWQMVKQLQTINEDFHDQKMFDDYSCEFYVQSVRSWVVGVTYGSTQGILNSDGPILLDLQINPLPCNKTSITTWMCNHTNNDFRLSDELCAFWLNSSMSISDLANRANIRTGDIEEILEQTSYGGTSFEVIATFNQSCAICSAAFSSFLMQLCLLVFVLGALYVLRRDSSMFAFGPLRRMLKIVAQYAKNPLASVKESSEESDDEASEHGGHGAPENKLGNYETEQLINAVSKITDLLRKCWGVAGADIISTNLATQEGALTEVFNPTVPGKSVYALFGFAAISDFDYTLRQLGGDVMILINDVATVLHGEVFRWAWADSGQCNKNLGAAFLMVYKIGSVEDVIQKLEQATYVIFENTKTGVHRRGKNPRKSSMDHSVSSPGKTTSRRRKSQRAVNSSRAAMSLSLQSLPGISTFTDRAVIGMLKSFAGIYRDNKLLDWKKDLRLGAGVGAFSVNMIFGMDAGWAVEGAVGSEYKIDATYLSPHVNMASRMMSACKQYGVSILLSQAVEELMSEVAQSKLRHIDTITVKGSILVQKIYTYDARHQGVDFFLFERSDEQADLDSEHYSPNVWKTDQDLTGMRQHVTEDFEEDFKKGRDAYLAGDWPKALKHLNSANEIMVENVMDQGYIGDELDGNQSMNFEGDDLQSEALRAETGDGPSRRLIAYMESEG
eukprot:CAMPEP_0194206706 /NCGR_PEP_ID=MMETSP0156-20130528/5658_1 /TAXON_ID=33649 /ORGANISM="Thalassionema nitzschioides, Strain L26-B" /LENGTH=1220 /DNA_ID=CAMNT_0038933299 /DNA_START=87 /DNA_END=3746 /DNA_ORIENTATION=-